MTIVVSIGENGEIGRGGDLCWHIREDLKRFKELTMGGAVIMGRKTWESLPRKPLPGRLNIVITRSANEGRRADGGMPVFVSSLQDAIKAAGELPAFVIGGESIYREALPLADRLEITRIYESDARADRFFPDIIAERWTLTEASEPMDSPEGLRFRYESYEDSAAVQERL